jgi:hypothetical protein
MARAARPTPFRGKWRIRWIDHEGKRQSDVFDVYAEAEKELRKRQVEAEEVRAGRELPSPTDHTFGELRDYWEARRVPSSRTRPSARSVDESRKSEKNDYDTRAASCGAERYGCLRRT